MEIKTIEVNNNGTIITETIEVDEDVLTENVLIDGNTSIGTINNDIHYVNSQKDKVIEEIDGGIDTVSSLETYSLNNNVENLILENVEKQELINGIECLIYGNPEDNRWILDTNQIDTGIIKVIDNGAGVVPTILNFFGCCGIVAIENLLIMAGKIINKQITYNSSLSYQDNTENYDLRQDFLMADIIKNDECKTDGTNENKLGGIKDSYMLYGQNFTKILSRYGIQCDAIKPDENKTNYDFCKEIGNAVRNGKGVMLTVNDQFLSSTSFNLITNHVITITGVAYEKGRDNIKYFYISDGSVTKENAYRIDIETMLSIISINSTAIITKEPLKNTNNNINGTGNELNNEITGNDGNNILKGESGNDKIYGKDGNDIIIGDSVTLSNDELKKLKKDNKEINIVYFEAVRRLGFNPTTQTLQTRMEETLGCRTITANKIHILSAGHTSTYSRTSTKSLRTKRTVHLKVA